MGYLLEPGGQLPQVPPLRILLSPRRSHDLQHIPVPAQSRFDVCSDVRKLPVGRLHEQLMQSDLQVRHAAAIADGRPIRAQKERPLVVITLGKRRGGVISTPVLHDIVAKL